MVQNDGLERQPKLYRLILPPARAPKMMLLAAVTPLESRLIAAAVAAAVGALAVWVIAWARGGETGRIGVKSLTRRTEVIVLVPWVVVGMGVLGWVAIGLYLGTPPWALIFGAPVLVWAGWWIPAAHRLTSSQASIVLLGRPDEVSAFVADVAGHARWGSSVVSCTPTMPGPRGPRFDTVEKMPDGGEITGTVELTKNEPGVQVVIQLVGLGLSGDYWSFTAQDGGTLVTQRTVVEVPYAIAITGTLLTAARAVAPGAHQRRVDELNALKAAFESQLGSISTTNATV